MESWELEIEADLLRQERDEAQADAERYRWLKRQGSTDDYDTRVNVIDGILGQYSEKWDDLIDAARESE